MGSSQSKIPALAVEEKLAERLEAMKLQKECRESYLAGNEKDYVYIDHRESPPTHDLSVSKTEEWEKELMQDPKNRLALSALSSANPRDVLTQRSSVIAETQTFNIKIPIEGSPVTNQRSSGRCWLFASTNVFRIALMRRHNLKEFELSQAYLFFWDKLEKANYFLEQVLDTTDEDLEDRLLQTMLQQLVSDGGQWDMVANLVEKYGLVPQVLYPDSWNAKNSAVMNSLIKTKLREDAIVLRRMAKSARSASSLASAKEKMVQEIHLVMTLMLGPPPNPNKTFTWETYDKNNKLITIRTTPLDFAAELSSAESVRANSGTNVHRLFSLVNDPRNEYGQLLTVSRLGNVHGARGITYVNVDMATIKAACIATLKAGIPIFFGSDVGKYSNGTGIMDTDLYDYELGFNIRLGMTKEERLTVGESAMTHAMVLTAVHVVDGKSVRWRVENSWGETAGEKGYFVMSDKWMDEWVYQAVVDPRFVSKEIHSILDKEPIVLPLWDPMGALA